MLALLLVAVTASAAPPRGKTPDLLFEEVVLGELHGCGRTSAGRVACWGRNDRGQLGTGTFDDSSYPLPVVDLPPVAALAAGAFHTCAILEDRRLACWGDNQTGQLGAGNLSATTKPVVVKDIGPVLQLGLGDTHTCAVTVDGTVSCWGNNLYGQLGLPNLRTTPRPAPVPGLPTIRGVAAGYGHTCALPEEGPPLCWGDPSKGQLGRAVPQRPDPLPPLPVDGAFPAIRAIAARGDLTCALTVDGVQCWGPKPVDTEPKPSVETVVAQKGLVALSMGWGHGCALAGGGEAVCFGDDRLGQLGTRETGLAVVKGAYGLRDVRSVAAGNGETCAARGVAGRTVCWGSYTLEEQAAAAREKPEYGGEAAKPVRYQVPPGTELLVSMDEVLDPTGVRPRVLVQTVAHQPCANARIDNVATFEKKRVTLKLGEVFLPAGDCLAATGPASAWVELPAFESGRFDLVLKHKKKEDFYQVFLKMDRIEIIPLQESFSIWEGEPLLFRIPPGSMAISCIDHDEAPVCERRARDGLPTCRDLLADKAVREAPPLIHKRYANAWFSSDPGAVRISPDEGWDAYRTLFTQGWRDGSGCTEVNVRTWRGELWTNRAP